MQACTRALRRSLAAKIALSALIAVCGSVMLRVMLVLFATVQPAPAPCKSATFASKAEATNWATREEGYAGSSTGSSGTE